MITPLPFDLARPLMLPLSHRLAGWARRLCEGLGSRLRAINVGRPSCAAQPPLPLYWHHIEVVTPPKPSRRWRWELIAVGVGAVMIAYFIIRMVLT